MIYDDAGKASATMLLDDGLTPNEVGALLDIAGRTVRRWLPSVNGSHSKNCSPRTLPAMAAALAEAKAALKSGSGVVRAAGVKKGAKAVLEIPSGAARHPSPSPAGRVKKQPSNGKTFVITAAQNATPVHRGFLASLKQYCQFNGAELIVIPYRYQNPSSIFSESMQDSEWWAADIAANLCADRIQLAKTLILCADIKIQASSAKPLTGLHHETTTQSAIFGHPRLAVRTLAVPQGADPKQNITTGACTQRNYTDTKLGRRGHAAHVFGATVVRVVGDVFHHRQLDALEDGSFMDLQYEYKPSGVREYGRIAGIVMGDSHVDFVAPAVVKATFDGPDSMIGVLKPLKIVGHDIIDCHPISHHNEKDPVLKIAKHFNGTNDIEAEIYRAFAFLDKYIPSDCLLVLPESNHHEHLDRWIRDNSRDPARDPTNVLIWAQLFSESIKHKIRGESFQAFAWMAKTGLGRIRKTKFLKRDESYVIAGHRVSDHGDAGAGGSRGSLQGFANLAINTIFGHGHGPGREGKAIQVGTNTVHMDYARGASSWMHTNALIYPNGKATLINFIRGEWR